MDKRRLYDVIVKIFVRLYESIRDTFIFVIRKFGNVVSFLVFILIIGILSFFWMSAHLQKSQSSLPSGDLCVHVDMKRALFSSEDYGADGEKSLEISEHNFCKFLSNLFCIGHYDAIKVVIINFQEGLNISLSRIFDIYNILQYLQSRNKKIYVYLDNIHHIGMLLFAHVSDKIYMNMAGIVCIVPANYISTSFEDYIYRYDMNGDESSVYRSDLSDFENTRKSMMIQKFQNKAFYRCAKILKTWLADRKIDCKKLRSIISANEAVDMKIVTDVVYDVDEVFVKLKRSFIDMHVIEFNDFEKFAKVNMKKMFKFIIFDDKNHEAGLDEIKKAVLKFKNGADNGKNYIIRINAHSINPTISRKIVYFLLQLPESRIFGSIVGPASVVEFSIISAIKKISINDFCCINFDENGLATGLHKMFINEIMANCNIHTNMRWKLLSGIRMGFECQDIVMNLSYRMTDMMIVQVNNLSIYDIFIKNMMLIKKKIMKLYHL